ncbi:hypothetical protein KQI84_08015 [bacterium]|nr:hypothetical protein [bacterium]
MLESMTLDDFLPHVGEALEIQVSAELALPVQLKSVDVLGREPAEGKRRPFSVIISGPREPILPQGIYTLRHEKLGELELFIVPIGNDSDGTRYEIVFN